MNTHFPILTLLFFIMLTTSVFAHKGTKIPIHSVSLQLTWGSESSVSSPEEPAKLNTKPFELVLEKKEVVVGEDVFVTYKAVRSFDEVTVGTGDKATKFKVKVSAEITQSGNLLLSARADRLGAKKSTFSTSLALENAGDLEGVNSLYSTDGKPLDEGRAALSIQFRDLGAKRASVK